MDIPKLCPTLKGSLIFVGLIMFVLKVSGSDDLPDPSPDIDIESYFVPKKEPSPYDRFDRWMETVITPSNGSEQRLGSAISGDPGQRQSILVWLDSKGSCRHYERSFPQSTDEKLVTNRPDEFIKLPLPSASDAPCPPQLIADANRRSARARLTHEAYLNAYRGDTFIRTGTGWTNLSNQQRQQLLAVAPMSVHLGVQHVLIKARGGLGIFPIFDVDTNQLTAAALPEKLLKANTTDRRPSDWSDAFWGGPIADHIYPAKNPCADLLADRRDDAFALANHDRSRRLQNTVRSNSPAATQDPFNFSLEVWRLALKEAYQVAAPAEAKECKIPTIK